MQLGTEERRHQETRDKWLESCLKRRAALAKLERRKQGDLRMSPSRLKQLVEDCEDDLRFLGLVSGGEMLRESW